MDRDKVAHLLIEHGVSRVNNAVADQAVQTVAALKDGWDLTDWQVAQTEGAVYFSRWANGAVIEGVLCVNADDSDGTYAKIAASYPQTILLTSRKVRP